MTGRVLVSGYHNILRSCVKIPPQITYRVLGCPKAEGILREENVAGEEEVGEGGVRGQVSRSCLQIVGV